MSIEPAMTKAIRMRRDLAAPFGDPVWPEGIALVPFTDAMAESVHAVMLAGYGADDCPPFPEWWPATSTDPEFDPELIFIAQAEDRPIGVAHCWNTGFLKDLVVLPARRGRGIGEALLLTVLRANRDRGFAHLDLKVRANNSGAIRLYERIGFVPVEWL